MQKMTIGRMAWIGVCLCLWVLATTGAFANRDRLGNTFYEDPGTVRISPTSLNFGRTRASQTLAVERTFTIRNISGGPIQIDLEIFSNETDAVGNSLFRSVGDRSFTLGRNRSRVVRTQLRRSTVGLMTGAVQFTVNGQPFEVNANKSLSGGIDLAGDVVAAGRN